MALTNISFIPDVMFLIEELLTDSWIFYVTFFSKVVNDLKREVETSLVSSTKDYFSQESVFYTVQVT